MTEEIEYKEYRQKLKANIRAMVADDLADEKKFLSPKAKVVVLKKPEPTPEQANAMAAIKRMKAAGSQEASTVEPIMTPEQKLALSIIREWKSDVAIRTEFRGDFKQYCFYREAMAHGRVKILSGQVSG